jgi:hypothetical protein
MTPSTSFALNFYVGRGEYFLGKVLALFFFVLGLNSFQGGMALSEWPALQWNYPPLIYGYPALVLAPALLHSATAVGRLPAKHCTAVPQQVLFLF